MANVRFIKTTKQKYLNREVYNEDALYFCEDTNEIFKGSEVYTDGIRVVPTKADLPECACAADGTVYYVTDTRNGFTLSPDRTEWLQTIYAPAMDIATIPESEIYNTVTTVGAVRDIKNAIYAYIDEEIAEVDGGVFNAETHYDFPSVGKVNMIYKAESEKLTYQWNDAELKYEILGGSSTPDINLIDGGNANG